MAASNRSLEAKIPGDGTAGPVRTGLFRSLRNPDYRIWAAGALVSNIGTWMQRVAQDWLVLTQLTHHNATAVGLVTALQFGPQLLLLPLTGAAADRFDRRRLLLLTQGMMVALAFALGLLVVTGLVRLWQVFAFAALLGCVNAFDAPARQVFVSELVGEADLSNAVALNSTSFNAARMIGPALAGWLIAAIGTGAAFLVNAVATLSVVASLTVLRTLSPRRPGGGTGVAAGFGASLRYLGTRPDLRSVLLMLFLFGTFGLNFPIFISAMAVKVFHAGAGDYGMLTTTMAVGSITGSVLAARRERPRQGLLIGGAALFGAALGLAAAMPDELLFGAALVLVGVSAQTVTTAATSLVQLSTDPGLRGRVMALLLATTLGGVAVGGPFVGWVADRFGPRWALAVGAASGFAAAAVGLYGLWRARPACTAST